MYERTRSENSTIVKSHITLLKQNRWQFSPPSVVFLLSWSGVPAASAAPDATEGFPFFFVFLMLSFSLRSTERFREFCTLETPEPSPLLSMLDSRPCSPSHSGGRAFTTLGLRCNFRCCILLASPSTSLLLSSRVPVANTYNMVTQQLQLGSHSMH